MEENKQPKGKVGQRVEVIQDGLAFRNLTGTITNVETYQNAVVTMHLYTVEYDLVPLRSVLDNEWPEDALKFLEEGASDGE